MPTLPTSQYWAGVNIADECKNWIVDKAGVSRRALSRAHAHRELSDAANHLLSRQPRIVFSQCQSPQTTTNVTHDPLYLWQYQDRVDNGRQRHFRFVAMPSNIFDNALIGHRDGSGVGYVNSLYFHNVASTSFPLSIFSGSITINARPQGGTPPGSNTVRDAFVVDGVSVFNGLQIIDFVVEDEELTSLTSGVDTMALPTSATTGQPVTNIPADTLRTVVHEARATQLPVVARWSAKSIQGEWARNQASPGDASAMVVSNVAEGNGQIVNLLDHTVTSRSGTSPGVYCHGLYCGEGIATKTAGKQVKVFPRIRASTNAGDADVVIDGPNHLTGNRAIIHVTATTPAWQGTEGFVYLNPSGSDTSADADANKLDFLGNVVGGNLWIHAIMCERNL